MATTTTHWGRRAGSTQQSGESRIRVETLPVIEPVIVLPAGDDLASGRNWRRRIASAAMRRVRWAWRAWDGRPPAAESALAWLVRSAPIGDRAAGVAACPGQFDPCPGLTGGVLATIAAYADHDLVGRMVDWLARVQMPNGAFPDAGLRRASALNSAHAAQGLREASRLTRSPQLRSKIENLAQGAREFLASTIDGKSDKRGNAALPACSVALNDLVLAAPLMHSEGRVARANCERVFERARKSLRRAQDAEFWRGPLHVMLPGVEALIELGECSLARHALRQMAAAQRRDGSVPALPGGSWVSTTALAHLAKLWYRLDEYVRADRAMAWLRRRQERTGGFLGSYGRGACYYPRREVAWACKHFLDACQQQVAVAFGGQRASLPRSIDAHDGRLQAVSGWCATFAAGARIADVGCGRGRYLTALDNHYPHLRLTGIDPAAHLLDELPIEVETIQAGLLSLPLPDGSCDGAMAVESIEHALVPQRAVSELCRIVRPGGRILIIDKNRSHQPLSDCEPWERWFAPSEVSGWLEQHCRDVKCVAVPHARHREPTGLFLCWTGTKL